MSHVQAVILHKLYFNKREAESWVRRHWYKPIKKVHETVNYYRFRIRVPNEDLYEYRIIKLTDGGKAVVGFRRF